MATVSHLNLGNSSSHLNLGNSRSRQLTPPTIDLYLRALVLMV